MMVYDNLFEIPNSGLFAFWIIVKIWEAVLDWVYFRSNYPYLQSIYLVAYVSEWSGKSPDQVSWCFSTQCKHKVAPFKGQ